MLGCMEDNGEINICDNGCMLKDTFACLGARNIERDVNNADEFEGED